MRSFLTRVHNGLPRDDTRRLDRRPRVAASVLWQAPVLLLALSACAPARASTPAPRVAPAVAALRQRVDSMVNAPQFRSALFGILVVNPETGDTLVSHNAGKLFIPASNQKLLTGAVALQLLGGDYRYQTTVGASGPVVDGLLLGNLVVSGTGDPSVSDHMMKDAMLPLRAMADSVAAHGVRRITGAIVPGADAFPGATLGYGWAWDDLDDDYSAGVDELYFNEGFSKLVVHGGVSAGDSVTVRTIPARTVPHVRIWARTVAPPASAAPRGRARDLTIRQDSTDAATVILDGTIAVGDSAVLSIPHRDPSRIYLLALREALAERGIVAEGGVSPWRGTAVYPLFSTTSPPLTEILRAFEKPSQNQIGEILLRTLGRVRAGVGSADSGARVVRDQVLAWGAAPDGFRARDGSGLSRNDVVTPETIIRVLDAMRRAPGFATFRDALPLAGVDGTIAKRMIGTPAQGNVHAKTGTLDMVRSLSGYVTTADGHLLLFSILVNNWTVDVREVEKVQDAIAVQLATMQLGGR
ncbi:MAG: D-alanyl-D-alanine carboxypeptidase/D-alanyl-D-alanine-endopeptidase [Gemmatimonadota bacterium]